jgi:predicted nuclease with TOPRIM domain
MDNLIASFSKIQTSMEEIKRKFSELISKEDRFFEFSDLRKRHYSNLDRLKDAQSNNAFNIYRIPFIDPNVAIDNLKANPSLSNLKAQYEKQQEQIEELKNALTKKNML